MFRSLALYKMYKIRTHPILSCLSKSMKSFTLNVWILRCLNNNTIYFEHKNIPKLAIMYIVASEKLLKCTCIQNLSLDNVVVSFFALQGKPCQNTNC